MDELTSDDLATIQMESPNTDTNTPELNQPNVNGLCGAFILNKFVGAYCVKQMHFSGKQFDRVKEL